MGITDSGSAACQTTIQGIVEAAPADARDEAAAARIEARDGAVTAPDEANDELAAAMKQAGNEKLKSGDEKGALDIYQNALGIACRDALKSQLHSNCAHVLLKLSDREEEALSHCDGAICCDSNNVKAYWRGAIAAQRLQRHSAAMNYCTRGLAVDMENKEFRSLLQKSKAKVTKRTTEVDAEAVRLHKAAGDHQVSEGQASIALHHYDKALKTLGALHDSTDPALGELQRKTFESKALCHVELGEWWPAVMASERAAAYCNEQAPEAAVCEGRALRELGLLHTAEEKFRHATKGRQDANAVTLTNGMAEGPTPSSCSSAAVDEAEEAHQEVLAALRSVETGDYQAVMREIEYLRKALPEKEAVNWMYTVKVRCESEEGRQEMVGHGFLKPEWLELPQATFTARCMQKLLLYQVKKRLQQELSMIPFPKGRAAPAGGLAVQYSFAVPSSLRHPNAPLILRDRHVEDLRSRGLAVIDQAFDQEAMARLRGECEWLDKTMGILLKDDEDVCNPLQRRFDIPMSDRERVEASCKDTPVLFQVIDHLRGLPVLLEERLGLQLRVPETVMLACYPKGAFYRRHLDSYEGKDIPRKVTILLYCNPDWTPGDGGALKAWLGNEVVELEPRAGRIIVFMAQDIWHEVTESQKERYALTQWVWDVKKDSLGR